ncbi:MAG: hypothetical protein AAB608_01100 [Patescibacteria group bacterium]
MPTITSEDIEREDRNAEQRMSSSLWGGLFTGATAMFAAVFPLDVAASLFTHYYMPPEQALLLHDILLPVASLALTAALWLAYAIASPLRVVARKVTMWACLKRWGGMEQDTFEAAYWVGASVACGASMLLVVTAHVPLLTLQFLR